jgi:hypothetical protein
MDNQWHITGHISTSGSTNSYRRNRGYDGNYGDFLHYLFGGND